MEVFIVVLIVSVSFSVSFLSMYAPKLLFFADTIRVQREVIGSGCNYIRKYCCGESTADDGYPVFYDITDDNISHIQILWSVIIIHKKSLS